MKKYILLLLIASVQISVSSAQGKLLSYKIWKSVTKEDLEGEMKKKHVPSALLKVRYTVDIYDVTYQTKWYDGTIVMASGLYFVPRGLKEPMPELAFHHGTRIQPGRQENLTGEDFLSIGFAADGYAVLLPDYIGLGHGEKFHLYQLSKPLGQTTVDMLFAIRQLNDSLGVKLNNQLFITGYSEGGYAAIATNKLIQEEYSKDFKVTAASGMSGAYDMNGVQSEVMFKPYGNPHYLPYLLRAINEVYHIVPYDINKVYKSPYDTLIPHLFDGLHDIHAINKALPNIPGDMVLDSIVNLYKTDPNYALHKVLKENSLCDWKPENPVKFCYCNSDEQVNYKNALVAHKDMEKLGAKHITLCNGGKKYGHNKCAIFASMYTKLYFDSFRNGSKYGRKGNVNKRFLLALAHLAIKA